MKGRLFVLSGRLLGTDHRFEGEAVLGRGPSADVRLRDASVSREHARLVPEAGGWRLIDLGSSNGTWVKDERVEDALLEDRAEFRLGSLSLRIRMDEEAPAASPPVSPARTEPEPVPTAPLVEEAPAPEEELVLEEDPVSLPPVEEPAAAVELELDLELEGDWDETAAPVAVSAAPKPTPAPAAPRPGPKSPAVDPTRPVLRASEGAGARGAGLLSSDLSQQPLLVRWALYLIAIGLFLGLAWGTYNLVFGVRSARSGDSMGEDFGEDVRFEEER